ncbi:nuclear transport factor 2 family protein [Streptomyces sp. NPDC053474]|uniref:nuclear transport factor 2 family protein n=1 Tax=Streptomyces sp. NPDC053474 TaxID=3365704 RepID=UPI0037CEAE7C
MTDLTEPRAVVDRQLAAYNAHDIDAFTATYTEDVVIHQRDGSELRGREILRERYEGQFARARCRAEIVGRLTEGDWVVDHEIAHGLGEGPLRVLVAYHLRDGLIDRVDFLS